MNKSREKLKLILKSKSILRGDFTLASGKQCSYYIDARRTTLNPEGAALISEIFLGEITSLGDVTAVGGPSIGADPIVGATILRSHQLDMPLRGFIVRKKEKEHGTGRIIEGELLRGDGVVIVEDVITTGGSVLRAVDLVEAAGAKVRGVFCVVDRGEETEKTFAERGCRFFSIFRVSELL